MAIDGTFKDTESLFCSDVLSKRNNLANVSEIKLVSSVFKVGEALETSAGK